MATVDEIRAWDRQHLSPEDELISTLRTALRRIRDHEGKVCPDYDLCQCAGCRSSYAAWAIADAALKGDK